MIERPARRRALRFLATAGVSVALPSAGYAQSPALSTRPIPSTGERIPAVGLGTWITFNVGNDTVARDACAEVMHNFVAAGVVHRFEEFTEDFGVWVMFYGPEGGEGREA